MWHELLRGRLVMVVASLVGWVGFATPAAADYARLVTSSTTVTASPNPTAAGQPVVLAATVTCPAGTPTGTVTFFDGPNLLATVTLDAGGHASLTTSFAATGDHEITAAYSGDGTCAASYATLTVTVHLATSHTTVAAAPSPVPVGVPVVLTATVTCPAGTPTGTVSFFDSPNLLATVGMDTGSHASLTTSFAVTGNHEITATYSGNGSCGASYATLTVTVTTPATSTTTLTAAPNPAPAGQPVTLTAIVTCTAGTPTGTVTFSDGPTTLGTATLDPAGTATLTVTTLPVGQHTITAHYNGDASCPPSTSTPVTVTITVPCQTISGTHYGNLIITQPTCLAPGTQVYGGVILQGGSASLDAEGANILGSLIATGGTGLRLCGSTVDGVLDVSGINGVIVIGDVGDNGPPPCAGNRLNPVHLHHNTGFLEFSANGVGGTVSVHDNTTTLVVPPHDATELQANDIAGSFACFGNQPPPTNHGKPNRVLGTRFGQCVAL